LKVKITRGKFDGINACADNRGVIAALAVDHRGNLLEAIAKARGENRQATATDMLAFKTAVIRMLSPLTSAVLVDPEYGLEAISTRAQGCGVLLAYEKSGYDVHAKGRLPDLLPEWSVQRLVEAGAQAIKILLFYNPFDEAQINAVKKAYVERIGAECLGLDVPFFLEPLVYDDAIGDDKGVAFARKKPEYVRRVMEEFSQSRYGVDILKVELPVNPSFVSGIRTFSGVVAAYTRQEAISHIRYAANAASKPFIYLSAGSSDEVFCDMLELAAEAGVRYSGVLCGRATWQDAIAIYANQGTSALEGWLADRGKQNIQVLNDVLARSATAWWSVYGGRDNVEVIERELADRLDPH
jgi:tagatose 1,6-diphosphate aldolase